MFIEEFNKKIIINTGERCDCGKFDKRKKKYGKMSLRGIICDECGIELKHKRIYFDKQEFFQALNKRQQIKYPK